MMLSASCKNDCYKKLCIKSSQKIVHHWKWYRRKHEHYSNRFNPHKLLLGGEVEYAAHSGESLQFEVADICIKSHCRWYPVVPLPQTLRMNGGVKVNFTFRKCAADD